MRPWLVALLLFSLSSMAQTNPSTLIFWEEGFPTVDTLAPDRAALAALPDSRFANAQELSGLLASADTKLLVLPTGPHFPRRRGPRSTRTCNAAAIC